MKDNERAEIIKQFPAEVVEVVEKSGKTHYACPTCDRAIAAVDTKCPSCGQVFSWDSIRKVHEDLGPQIATLTFEVLGDFKAGECQRCPLSFIGKQNNDIAYECSLKMRGNCKLKITRVQA